MTRVIGAALPWTLGLLSIATMIGFFIGTLLGALMVAAPGRWKHLLDWSVPIVMIVHSIPYLLLGIMLIALFAVTWAFFPVGSGYTLGESPEFSLKGLYTLAKHAFLPAFVSSGGSRGWLGHRHAFDDGDRPRRGLCADVEGDGAKVLAASSIPTRCETRCCRR